MFEFFSKKIVFSAVLFCIVFAFTLTGSDAQNVVASTLRAPILDCASSSPQNYPTSPSWVYPKGFSKSDITQGLIANSPVHNGEFHTGEDYGNKPAGTEVIAVADGWVACQFTNLDKGNFGHAVFVESILPNGEHLTTIYGHLSGKDEAPVNSIVRAGITRIGRLGTQAENGNWPVHVHIGIRDGFFIEREQGWPSDGWGATPSASEFAHWHALSTWTENPPASVQSWRTESTTLSFILPWWRTFFVCDERRIKVSLDGTPLFYTSSQDGPDPSQTARVFVLFGNHTLKTELFDNPSANPVIVDSLLFPQQPACASEPTAPTSTPETPVRIFFDALARGDLDTIIDQCFAPQHRLLAKPLLDAYQSTKNDQGLNLNLSNLNYKTISNDGQKGLVQVTGVVALRDKTGKQYQYSFDVDVPVFSFLNTWYIDLDLQRLQQLLEQMSG